MTQTANLRRLKKFGEWIFLVGILVFAYQISRQAGERGFFAFDQSILFDGGYRVFLGQIPFRDFVIPFGPMALWLQGVVFRLFGISYANYILGAAIINLLAAAMSYRILRLLFPRQTIPAILGSLLTAVWFYAPSGTPWIEQTAFFFGLMSLLSLLTGLTRVQDIRLKRGLYVLAGLSAFLVFISKQNAGALWLLVPGFLLLVMDFQDWQQLVQDSGVFWAGWFSGLLVFALWLLRNTDVHLFFRHFFVIPLTETGINRMPDNLYAGLHAIFVASGSGVAPVLLTLIFAAALLIFLSGRTVISTFRRSQHDQRLPLALIMALYLYQNLFQITSNNQPENAIPYIGLITASAWGLLMSVFTETPSRAHAWRFFSVKILTLGTLIILMGMVFFQGIKVAISRQVHDIYPNSSFDHFLAVDKLTAIRWAEPTFTRSGTPISAAQVAQLADFLKSSGENFFIFPDFTVLYGALDVPSPQPLLWFHKRVTYPKKDNAYLDAWIIADLEKYRVNIIVLEAESWYGDRLGDFPQLKAFLKENFIFEQEIGIFLIYIRENP